MVCKERRQSLAIRSREIGGKRQMTSGESRGENNDAPGSDGHKSGASACRALRPCWLGCAALLGLAGLPATWLWRRIPSRRRRRPLIGTFPISAAAISSGSSLSCISCSRDSCWACRFLLGCAKSSAGSQATKRYDKLAKEFTKLLTSSYATTALFGGILLFLLIGVLSQVDGYLTDIFFPSFLVYCLLFLVETATLYLYWYGWDAMRRAREKVSYFPGLPPECLRVLHHDRAEFLGDVPSQSGRALPRARISSGPGPRHGIRPGGR